MIEKIAPVFGILIGIFLILSGIFLPFHTTLQVLLSLMGLAVIVACIVYLDYVIFNSKYFGRTA
tara:strand:- start:758 stop:949 length:192 start_codon:yes stop_codon:yes gene_type:complete